MFFAPTPGRSKSVILGSLIWLNFPKLMCMYVLCISAPGSRPSVSWTQQIMGMLAWRTRWHFSLCRKALTWYSELKLILNPMYILKEKIRNSKPMTWDRASWPSKLDLLDQLKSIIYNLWHKNNRKLSIIIQHLSFIMRHGSIIFQLTMFSLYNWRFTKFIHFTYLVIFHSILPQLTLLTQLALLISLTLFSLLTSTAYLPYFIRVLNLRVQGRPNIILWGPGWLAWSPRTFPGGSQGGPGACGLCVRICPCNWFLQKFKSLLHGTNPMLTTARGRRPTAKILINKSKIYTLAQIARARRQSDRPGLSLFLFP